MSEEPVEIPTPPATGAALPFFQTRIFVMLLPLVFLLGLGAGYLIWGQGAAAATAAVSPAGQGQAAAETPQKITRYDVPVDDDPVLGPENAAVTIVEFSDYQCPFCTRWHKEVLPRLMEKYPNQVRLVYRDFPLESIHPDAIPAAEAANCAGEQEAYWPYHEMLFNAPDGLGKSALLKYAGDLDLDMQSFETCVDERRYQDEVSADYAYAMNLGVRSTPTFFINGIALVGAQPYEVFEDVIEKELAGEIPE